MSNSLPICELIKGCLNVCQNLKFLLNYIVVFFVENHLTIAPAFNPIQASIIIQNDRSR